MCWNELSWCVCQCQCDSLSEFGIWNSCPILCCAEPRAGVCRVSVLSLSSSWCHFAPRRRGRCRDAVWLSQSTWLRQRLWGPLSAEEKSVTDIPTLYTCMRNLSCLCLVARDAEVALVSDKQRRSVRIMRNKVESLMLFAIKL